MQPKTVNSKTPNKNAIKSNTNKRQFPKKKQKWVRFKQMLTIHINRCSLSHWSPSDFIVKFYTHIFDLSTNSPPPLVNEKFILVGGHCKNEKTALHEMIVQSQVRDSWCWLGDVDMDWMRSGRIIEKSSLSIAI